MPKTTPTTIEVASAVRAISQVNAGPNVTVVLDGKIDSDTKTPIEFDKPLEKVPLGSKAKSAKNKTAKKDKKKEKAKKK